MTANKALANIDAGIENALRANDTNAVTVLRAHREKMITTWAKEAAALAPKIAKRKAAAQAWMDSIDYRVR